MGKKARLRALKAESNAAADIDEARTCLLRAALTVSYIFGDEPDCAGAAALLAGIGSEFGLPLRARAVSVIAINTATGDIFFMGRKARQRFTADQLASFTDFRRGGKDTGHMVVTSDDALLLLDPNLTQARSYGIDAPAIALRVNSTDPTSGEWNVILGDFQALYILDEENDLLAPRFEAMTVEMNGLAKHIGGRLRDGLDPAVVAGEVKNATPQEAASRGWIGLR